jgi:hypothetical protein
MMKPSGKGIEPRKARAHAEQGSQQSDAQQHDTDAEQQGIDGDNENAIPSTMPLRLSINSNNLIVDADA